MYVLAPVSAFPSRFTDFPSSDNGAKRLLAAWRVLLGVWAPHAKSEAVAALRHFGVTEKIEGENEVRRVLRLRLEATKALREFLLTKAVEEKDREGERVLSVLKGAGAKISKGKGAKLEVL